MKHEDNTASTNTCESVLPSKQCACGASPADHCPKCGSCPSDHWVDRDLDHGMMGLDGDVMCSKCGSYVRLWNV